MSTHNGVRGRPGLQGWLAALLSPLTLPCLSQAIDIDYLQGGLPIILSHPNPQRGHRVSQTYKSDAPQYDPRLHCYDSNRVGLTYKVAHPLHPHINLHCGAKVGQAFGGDPSDHLYHF